VAQVRLESFYPHKIDLYADFVVDAAKEMSILVSKVCHFSLLSLPI